MLGYSSIFNSEITQLGTFGGVIGSGLYNPEQLKQNQEIVQDNPTIEIGLDNYGNYISQVLDNGGDFFYNRGSVLNAKSFQAFQDFVEKDAQVIACLERLKLSVLQLGLTVKCASEDPRAEKLCKFWEFVFNDMTGTIQDVLYQLYSSVIYGYSISEINYKYCLFEGQKVLSVKDIKNKNTGVFQFDLDGFGNILSITNLYDPNNPLPKDKFIYMTWKPKYNNPYGFGLGETLYYLCWAKKQCLKNGLTGQMKWANPSVYIELPPNPDSAQIEAAQTFANEIQNTSAGTLPNPLKAHLLGGANGSNDPSIAWINFLNSEIAKTINLTSAMTSENQNGGSYAAKQVEATSALISEQYLKTLSEDIIKEMLIRRLTPLNFPVSEYPLELYPEIVFNPATVEDKNALIDRAVKLRDAGFISEFNEADKKFVRSIDGYQEEDQPQDVIDMDGQALMSFNSGGLNANNVIDTTSKVLPESSIIDDESMKVIDYNFDLEEAS